MAGDVLEALHAHARSLVAGERTVALAPLLPDAPVTPADLLAQLTGRPFTGYEVVAHARIGRQHLFKVKFLGPVSYVVQSRWGEQGDSWRLLEVELARVAAAEEEA